MTIVDTLTDISFRERNGDTTRMILEKFIDVTRTAILSRNFNDLDRLIKKQIPQYLWQFGDGCEKNLRDVLSPQVYKTYSRYWSSGLKKKKFVKQLSKDSEISDNTIVANASTKLICWREDKRGYDGETLLHICLENGGRIYRELAMRLLKFYPKLAVDIYLGEKFYGKSCLHLAIGNEDPAMVRILLRCGADVNERCFGEFQTAVKSSAANTGSVDKISDYGYSRAHEYPLFIAATFHLEDCYRWILAKGGDPTAQDIYGNTILHVLVYEDNLDMFDKVYKMGKCNTSIKNWKGFTPLTLAAKKARKSLFNYILEMSSQRQWKYNTVVCDAYPLAEVDTVLVTDVEQSNDTDDMSDPKHSQGGTAGKLNKHSALELIVHGKRFEHLNLLDGVMYEILYEKWKAFGRNRLIWSFILFNIYYLIMLVAFFLRPSTSSWTDFSGSNDTACYMLEINSSTAIIRVTCECMVILGATFYVISRLTDAVAIGLRAYVVAQVTIFPSKALFSLSLFLIFVAIPFRFTCMPNAENNIIVLTVLMTGPYELFFCRGIKFLGPFVIMIYNMILGDVLRFVIIYSIFIIGFSQSMYILFVTHNAGDDESIMFTGVWESMFGMFIISLGEFEHIYLTFDYTNNALLAKMIFLVFTVLAMVLLVNLLIAMMGNTYAQISETKKEWLRQWATVVLDIERGMSEKRRYLALLSYSQPMDADLPYRSFIVRRRLDQ